MCIRDSYQSVIVMPQSASKEKIDQLEMLGAELILVPSVPHTSSQHYIHTAREVAAGRSARERNGAIWARQFDNPANRRIHHDTTGQEIWDQTGGEIDGFICAVGTGGTLSGGGQGLRDNHPTRRNGQAKPPAPERRSTPDKPRATGPNSRRAC